VSSLVVGLIILVLLLVLLGIGVPIAFALGLTSLISIVLFLSPGQFNSLGEILFSELNNFTLLAIPLFIFMGAVFGGSKASGDLFQAGQMWLGKLRGGLAMSSVVACGLFAALCGASSATTAAIGQVAVPEMRQRGYSNQVATGAVVAGGTLGILIPPSVTLILYGIATEQSIGQLFLGGVIPGLIIVGMFCAWIFIAVSRERRGGTVQGIVPNPGTTAQTETGTPEAPVSEEDWPLKQRLGALLKVIPFILLIVAILFSLYGGYATPSEAAAVGAFLSLVMVIVYYHSTMSWKKLVDITLDATGTSTMVMMIVALSGVLGVTMSFLSIPQELAQLISALEINRWWIMVVINFFLLVLGFFLPPVSIILMVTPILYPIITTLDFDPIWFGVLMTINMEMGLITPPVGLNLYVVKGIAPDIPLRDILMGSIPYVIVLALALVLFCFFPGLITWLPDKLFAG
jgi:tripartite ATP-independent transporter DctM subunit